MKICPIKVASSNRGMPQGSFCIGDKCMWFCEWAGECAIPLIAGILADSTINQEIFMPQKNPYFNVPDYEKGAQE